MSFFAAYGVTSGPAEHACSVDPLVPFSGLFAAFPA
jgi:hypothetical protein